jgi:hypothetical protein
MRSHISVHRATSKYFSNSFIFKNKIEKEGLPGNSTPDLGAGGPGSNPGAPTIHNPSDPSGNLANVGSSSTAIAVI